jgi:hypothetical protein
MPTMECALQKLEDLKILRRDRPAWSRSLDRAALLLVLALSVGCVSIQPKIPHSARPSATSGYVGGLFAKDTIVGFGFSLRNERTHEEYVLEIEDKAVSLIAVPPGRYRVASWLTWSAVGSELLTRKDIPAGVPFGQPFDVEAGQVMLLGSWFADKPGIWPTFTIASHRITEDEALAAFQAAYPGFATQLIRCLHCVP